MSAHYCHDCKHEAQYICEQCGGCEYCCEPKQCAGELFSRVGRTGWNLLRKFQRQRDKVK